MTQVIFDTQSIGYEAKPGDTITIHSPTVRGNGGVTIGTAPHKIAVYTTQTLDLYPGPIVIDILCRGWAGRKRFHTTVPETGPVTLWQLIKEAE